MGSGCGGVDTRFFQARIIWHQPLVTHDLLNTKLFRDILNPDQPICPLISVVDPRFLVAQRHTFEAVRFHRVLNPGAK